MNTTPKENPSSIFAIPWASNQMDIMTPHKLAVVFLIQEYLIIQRAPENSVTPKHKRQFCLLLLKLIQYPDMPYKDLYKHLTSANSGVVKEHLEGFEGLMKLLTQMGIEVLFDVQGVVDKLMSENVSSGVALTGIVGLYLRRVHVTLDKMTFPELMSLYKSILVYYEKGVRALAIATDLSFDNDNDSNKINDTQLFLKERARTHCKWSLKQSELFVAQQSTLLTTSETDALNPIEMESKLKEIIQDNPKYSQAQFLSYMNHLRVRDYPNALDALHRAFDRPSEKSNSTNTTTSQSNSDTKGFQFSSLNLAILHAQFDHKAEALASLRECIMLAQECGDRVCLQIAQSWLCYLDKTQIQMNEKLVANKAELSLVHSVSLGIQFVVKQAAQSGFQPSKLFDLLLKSDILNCQHSMMGLIGNCVAEKAAVWTLYGKNDLASLFSQLLLNSNLKALSKPYNGEGNCQSLCCIIIWLSLQGEYILSSVVIEHAKKRFPRPPLSKFWMICECYSNSVHSIYRQKWKDGQESINSLYVLDDKLGTLQLGSLNIARGNLTYARSLLLRFLDNEDLDHLTRVRGMILLANALITSTDISPHLIDLINRALNIAYEKYLDYEYALLQMIYAYVLLHLDMPNQALKVIKEILEIILGNGGIYDKAKCNFLFVKCLLACTTSTEEKLQVLTKCLKILNESADYFLKLECYTKVKDVYIFVAKQYNELDLPNERNRYAYKFRKIEEQFPTSSEYLNIFY